MQRSFILSLLFLEYITVSLTGVCLLFFGVIGSIYKIHVLGATFVCALVPVSTRLYVFHTWKIQDIGFRFDNFKEAVPWYGLSAILGVAGLWFYSVVFNIERVAVNQNTLMYYSIAGSIAQEVLYRGYLMRLGKQLFGDGAVNSSVNIIVFVGMHVFYPGFWEKLPILIPAGVLFTLLYKKHPNIFLVSCVHILLNGVAVILGIFH